MASLLFCRDDKIRTCGLFVPNEARYRAALHPEPDFRTAKIQLFFIGFVFLKKLFQAFVPKPITTTSPNATAASTGSCLP